MTAISISTHVLDTATGLPAEGVPVSLAWRDDAGAWAELATGTTDADGRISDLATADAALIAGRYRVRFDLESTGIARASWYPEVSIVVDLAADAGHVHVPLLLAPYGYTTYRGS